MLDMCYKIIAFIISIIVLLCFNKSDKEYGGNGKDNKSELQKQIENNYNYDGRIISEEVLEELKNKTEQ
jgi:ABC-type cobalt transport system substrate-binding protein